MQPQNWQEIIFYANVRGAKPFSGPSKHHLNFAMVATEQPFEDFLLAAFVDPIIFGSKSLKRPLVQAH